MGQYKAHEERGYMQKIKNIQDLKQDTHNANKGTAIGQTMVDQSIERYGAGRSVVVDKNGNIIGGNKTVKAAQEAGLDIEVVKTSGDKLIVHQREDLDLYEGDDARMLAYVDNRSSELGLEWDADVLADDIAKGLDLGDMFSDEQIKDILDDAVEVDLPELSAEPDGFKRMTFVLTDQQAETVEYACSISVSKASTPEQSGNENKNGNALEYICARFNVSDKS